MALLDTIADNPAAMKLIDDPELGHVEAMLSLRHIGIDTSDASIRRLRKQREWVAQEVPEPTVVANSVRVEESPDGLTVYHDSWPVQLGENLDPLLEFFGYDPANFYVVDGTVRMSKWQSSKGTDDGGRDVIWLYSYQAKFRKIVGEVDKADDLDEVLAKVKAYKPAKRTPGGTLLEPIAYVHQQGDEQTGKSLGGGLEGVISRANDVVERSAERLKALRKTHANIEWIVDAANGDVVENIFGHYPSQQRTTDTLRKQFSTGRWMDINRTRTFSSFCLPIAKVYCTDNHGEMRQSIGLAPFTSESDNLTLILAESVQDVLAQSPIGDQIDWYIPHDEWWTLLTVAGLNIAVGHGHKAKGAIGQWVKNQRDNLTVHKGFRPHLALLGHKHHFMALDVSGTTMIQTPSLDGGSPFWEAISGDYSRPGAVSYLAGLQYNQYFSDLVVL